MDNEMLFFYGDDIPLNKTDQKEKLVKEAEQLAFRCDNDKSLREAVNYSLTNVNLTSPVTVKKTVKFLSSLIDPDFLDEDFSWHVNRFNLILSTFTESKSGFYDIFWIHEGPDYKFPATTLPKVTFMQIKNYLSGLFPQGADTFFFKRLNVDIYFGNTDGILRYLIEYSKKNKTCPELKKYMDTFLLDILRRAKGWTESSDFLPQWLNVTSRFIDKHFQNLNEMRLNDDFSERDHSHSVGKVQVKITGQQPLFPLSVRLAWNDFNETLETLSQLLCLCPDKKHLMVPFLNTSTSLGNFESQPYWNEDINNYLGEFKNWDELEKLLSKHPGLAIIVENIFSSLNNDELISIACKYEILAPVAIKELYSNKSKFDLKALTETNIETARELFLKNFDIIKSYSNIKPEVEADDSYLSILYKDQDSLVPKILQYSKSPYRIFLQCLLIKSEFSYQKAWEYYCENYNNINKIEMVPEVVDKFDYPTASAVFHEISQKPELMPIVVLSKKMKDHTSKQPELVKELVLKSRDHFFALSRRCDTKEIKKYVYNLLYKENRFIALLADQKPEYEVISYLCLIDTQESRIKIMEILSGDIEADKLTGLIFSVLKAKPVVYNSLLKEILTLDEKYHSHVVSAIYQLNTFDPFDRSGENIFQSINPEIIHMLLEKFSTYDDASVKLFLSESHDSIEVEHFITELMTIVFNNSLIGIEEIILFHKKFSKNNSSFPKYFSQKFKETNKRNKLLVDLLKYIRTELKQNFFPPMEIIDETVTLLYRFFVQQKFVGDIFKETSDINTLMKIIDILLEAVKIKSAIVDSYPTALWDAGNSILEVVGAKLISDPGIYNDINSNRLSNIFEYAQSEVLAKFKGALIKEDISDDKINSIITGFINCQYAYPSRTCLGKIINVSIPELLEDSIGRILDRSSDEILPPILCNCLKKITEYDDTIDQESFIFSCISSIYDDYPQGWMRQILKLLKNYKTLSDDWIIGFSFTLGALREPYGKKVPELLGKIANDKTIPERVRKLVLTQRNLFNRENFNRGHHKSPERRVAEMREFIFGAHKKHVMHKQADADYLTD